MIGFVFWTLGMALAIVLGVVSHLTPVLYHLCVFFERHIVFLAERATGRSLSIGGLVFASLVVWGALGALAGGLFLASSLGGWAILIPGTIAAAWGGSVGYQVGMHNLVFTYRQPGALPHHHPGNIGRHTRDRDVPWQDVPTGDWFAQGTVLGEAAEYDDATHGR